ncbi:DUF349 domain-containing protein [Rurimicrobium arvi]|uniref:DUF349 domain-containing protein n=1 Tax=Rurimicrobium arvi TaxID=2049916 RepID=A0ABP8MY69_9BACT
MDTPTQSATAQEQLKLWWDNKPFQGKEYCSIDEKGSLTVKGLGDRVVSILNHVTGDTVIQNLLDKFRDIEKHFTDFEKEWGTNEDKTKLLSRLSRLKESVENANAIGDIEALQHKIRSWHNSIEQQIDDNYKAKEALVKEAEGLSVSNNNWKDITQKLKDISEQWKTLGFVDKKRNDALWDKLEKIKEHFFEEKRQHQEDISKEMLQNLDLKMELVDKAEALADSENWKETTEIFKQLMEDWKKTGRTIPDKNEALWQRFIAAKNNFYDRKKLHTDQIKVEQEANYAIKIALVEKAEAMRDSTDWGVTAKAYNDLMDEWKKAGQAPAEHNNDLWNRFSAAKTAFFNAKKAHSNEYKNMLDENLKKKQSLIDRAESLKNSTRWKEATEELNQLFEEWKSIGHAGKEHKEHLWEQFISARKHFFRRKDEDRERRREAFEKHKEVHNIQLRNTLLNMESENAEDQAQVDELRQNIEHNVDGPKADELRAHMKNLIVEIEERISKRNGRIEDLKNQVHKAEQRENLDDNGSM